MSCKSNISSIVAGVLGCAACSAVHVQAESPLSTGNVVAVSDGAFGNTSIDLSLGYRAWRQSAGGGGQEEDSGGGEIEVIDDTGTDPRDFRNKFMPYYRFTELGNDVEVQEFVLFGLYAITPKFAMTYEWPIYKNIEWDVEMFGGASDGDVSSIGDLNLRFFYKPDGWSGKYKGSDKGWSLMPVLETTLPTAQHDVIGGNNWIIAPGFAWVTDLPGGPPFGLGFFAMMNFYDTNAWRDDGQEWTSRYRGRWFWMQPLSKPGPGLMDGIYLLTELQPVYDFNNDDFDLWLAPELGKMISESTVIYAKPGWSIVDREEDDREFTFELGFRFTF